MTGLMRELHIGSTGKDVVALQRALNARSEDRGLPLISTDGDLGPATAAAADRVCRALGALERTLQLDAITIGMQRMVLQPKTRTPRQLARARSRAAHAKAAAKAATKSTVKVSGNASSGGTAAQRRVACSRRALANDLAGIRGSFYSQPGKFTSDHTLTGEKHGERSDCSQHVIAIHRSAGDEDPNQTSFREGYTGSLANAMRQINTPVDGCTVIWDPWGPQGHTAIVESAARRQCIGHGSAHVIRHALTDFSYKGAPRFYVPR